MRLRDQGVTQKAVVEADAAKGLFLVTRDRGGQKAGRISFGYQLPACAGLLFVVVPDYTVGLSRQHSPANE